MKKQINGKWYELTECEAPKKTGWERAEEKGDYFTLVSFNSDGICNICDYYSENCDQAYQNAAYWTDEALAERMAFETYFRLKLLRFVAENGGDREWDGDNQHYFITRMHDTKEPEICSHYCGIHPFTVYFPTRQLAQQALELFKADFDRLYGRE